MENDSLPPSIKSPSGALVQQRWLVVLPLLLSVVVYVQTLQFDFVTYDDYELVYQNGDYLSQLSNVVGSFKTHAFTTHRAESAYYRPLLLVSYIFDYQLWGLNPKGYHLTNLLLHALTVLLVFKLIERLARERIVALVASALFAVHPIQTESVSWVAGRNDVLLGFFVVLMIYAYARYREESRRRATHLWMAMSAFTCALFTKESGAFYILLFPAYDLCYGHVALKNVFSRRSLRDLFVPVIILLLYLGVRWSVFGEIIGAERLYGAGTTLWERIQQASALLTTHCSLLFVPSRLSVVHPTDQLVWLQAPWMWLAIIVPVVFGLALWWSWRRDRTLCFGLSWIFVGLIPTLNLFPVAVQVLEHRLYVPMAGFALATTSAGYLLVRTRQMEKRSRKLVVQFAGVVIVLCAILSYARVPVWKNSESIWKDAIEKAPAYSRSYYNLAGWYFERREYKKTAELMETYTALVPTDFVGYSKLRQSYYLAGQYAQAARVCRKMIALSPTNLNRYAEAAELYMQMNQSDSAIAIYKEGIERNPASYQLCDLLGRALMRSDRPTGAEQWYRRAVDVNPQFAQGYFDLGVLYASIERSNDALARIEQGLKFGDPGKDVAQLLYHLYKAAGKESQADSVRQRYKF